MTGEQAIRLGVLSGRDKKVNCINCLRSYTPVFPACGTLAPRLVFWRTPTLRLTYGDGNNRNRRGWQNAASKYKGVSFRRNRGKWPAHICHLGEIKLLGHFASEMEAAKAYDRAARELHGEFAFANF